MSSFLVMFFLFSFELAHQNLDETNSFLPLKKIDMKGEIQYKGLLQHQK